MQKFNFVVIWKLYKNKWIRDFRLTIFPNFFLRNVENIFGGKSFKKKKKTILRWIFKLKYLKKNGENIWRFSKTIASVLSTKSCNILVERMPTKYVGKVWLGVRVIPTKNYWKIPSETLSGVTLKFFIQKNVYITRVWAYNVV